MTLAFARFDRLIWLIVFCTPPFPSTTPGDTCWYGQHQPVGGVGVRSALQSALHYKDRPEKCISICHLQSATAIIEAALLKWDLLSFGCQQRFKAFHPSAGGPSHRPKPPHHQKLTVSGLSVNAPGEGEKKPSFTFLCLCQEVCDELSSFRLSISVPPRAPL